MSAAGKREELEAAIWRQLTAYRIPELRLPSGRQLSRISTQGLVERILTAADAYAEAVADERIAGRVHDRTIGRERLAEATAETRKP